MMSGRSSSRPCHRAEVVVAFITGAGLKPQEAVMEALRPPLHLEPTIASFEQALGERDAVASQATGSVASA